MNIKEALAKFYFKKLLESEGDSPATIVEPVGALIESCRLDIAQATEAVHLLQRFGYLGKMEPDIHRIVYPVLRSAP